MSQKHIFQRPSVACEVAVGTTGTPTGASPGSAPPTFDALQRISNLRQSLGGVVASRATSLDRNSTPNVRQPGEVGELQESTARRLLTSSQRRVEELLRDNHQLELLCMKQDDIIKEIQFEKIANVSRQTAAPADASAVRNATVANNGLEETPSITRSRPKYHKTHGLSTRSKAGPTHLDDEVNGGESLVAAGRGASVAAELDDAVQRLVSTAIALFPELEVCVESASRRTAHGWSAACEVLNFIESRLEQWSEQESRENIDVGEASAIVSQALVSVELDQHEWCKSLFDLANRLQITKAEQQRATVKKDAFIKKLKRDIKSLSSELSDAVEERMQCECRCAELEEALSRVMENHVEYDTNVQRLRQQCNTLRSDTNTLLALAERSASISSSSGRHGLDNGGSADTKPTRDGLQDINVEHDTAILRSSIGNLTKERDDLRARLAAANAALKEATLSASAAEAEKVALLSKVKELGCDSGSAAACSMSTRQPTPTVHSEFTTSLCEPLLACDSHLDGENDEVEYTPDAQLVHIIRDLGADIFFSTEENGMTQRPGLLFSVGCAIVQDLMPLNGLLEADASFSAWKRVLLHLQNGFGDVPFHNADRAADNMQFFYSLLCHSGMLESMTPVEIIAAVTSALCTMYRHVDSDDGVSPPDSQLGGCVSGDLHACEHIVTDYRCSYETICELMKRSHFDFASHWKEEDRMLFLRTMQILLRPLEWPLPIECILHASGTEIIGSAFGKLHEPSVRHQFVRLFIGLAQHAYTMRSVSMSRYWAGQRLSFSRRRVRFTGEPGTAVGEAAADSQLLLIATSVLPVCQIVAQAFPALKSCLVALQGNAQVWARCDLKNNSDSTTPCTLPNELSTAKRQLPSDRLKFMLTAAKSAKCGAITVDTAGFVSIQEEVSVLHKENATLRALMNGLFSEMNAAREHAESAEMNGG